MNFTENTVKVDLQLILQKNLKFVDEWNKNGLYFVQNESIYCWSVINGMLNVSARTRLKEERCVFISKNKFLIFIRSSLKEDNSLVWTRHEIYEFAAEVVM